ncbi:hypothetical protein GGR36_002611 [Niveibacterium umoris]|uniref:Uncharacterized protein n=1 Tax=Niveibacterium umoris TaxID=1193620 RepID=A0A840BJ52_9RHOO|nr:hypothetical protein [Niveibacterium umoris]
MLFARDGLALVAADVAAGLGLAELGEAQRSSCSLRFALSGCGGLPVQAGSRPGGRGTFFVRTKKVPKESRPASTPLAAQGVPCAARNIGWLRNSALRASDSPRHRRCASDPDASALLGVSEGEGEASTFSCCPNLVARMQAAGRNRGGAVEHLGAPHSGYECATHLETAMVLTLGPVESAEQRSELGGSARSADGEDCLSGGRSLARVPQPPDFASTRGKSGAQHWTANAGSPFLGYFFWRSKRSNTPAGGGTPAEARLVGVIRRSARWASMPSAQATPTPTRDHDRQCQNMRRRP